VCQSRQTQSAAAGAGSHGRQAEADQSDLLVVGSRVDTIKDFQQCSFGGVSFPVCRLVLGEVGRLADVDAGVSTRVVPVPCRLSTG